MSIACGERQPEASSICQVVCRLRSAHPAYCVQKMCVALCQTAHHHLQLPASRSASLIAQQQMAVFSLVYSGTLPCLA